ncbi:hypothetical protein M1523_02315 [Patescibacteria group bacterium]|nr:hypothetical protein [Patescibacteria group bacterium]MCL5091445.1 hypothetical protein [Patescibacteria group bacterium]
MNRSVIKKTVLALIVVSAMVVFLSFNLPSGSHYCFQEKCGLFFWRSLGHDALWHLAVARTAFINFPPLMPTFSGVALRGYNYLYDLLLAWLARLGINPLLAYFKLLPVVWFGLFTWLLIKLAHSISRRWVFLVLFLAFFYFTGSFSYYFTLVTDRTIWGASHLLFHLIEPLTLNAQFGWSLLGLLFMLIKIQEKKINRITVLIFAGIIGVNFALKFYGGVVALVLGTLTVGLVCKDRRRVLFYSILFTAVAAVTVWFFYRPASTAAAGSTFIFSPFTSINPVTEDPHLFYLARLTSLRYVLAAKGLVLPWLLIELFNLTVFLFFYLGVRFFGLMYLAYRIMTKKATQLEISVAAVLLVTVLATALFVQTGEWTNIYQFFYYAVFFSTIPLIELAFSLYRKKSGLTKTLLCVIVILALPTTLDLARDTFRSPALVYLPDGELEALQELGRQPRGVVLSPPYDKTIGANLTDPKPLYAWGDTAYVSAFSGQPLYLADLWMEQITGIDYRHRLAMVQSHDCDILKQIDYVYYNNDFKIARSLFDCPNHLEFLWGNRTATIYRVKK